jgi:aryl-phospho-beta-D-glucosidase BglC (GH1 family)
MLFRKDIFVSISLVFFIGCGGSGGGGSSEQTIAPADIKTGYFIDAPVEGLLYSTPTLSGFTNSDGMFKYRNAEGIKFYIDKLEIGQVAQIPTDSKVTPQDLVGVSRDETDNVKVIKIAKLLQSFDDDGDISLSIKISPSSMPSKKLEQLSEGEFNQLFRTNSKVILSNESVLQHLNNSMIENFRIKAEGPSIGNSNTTLEETILEQNSTTTSEQNSTVVQTPFVSEKIIKKYTFDSTLEDWYVSYSGACTLSFDYNGSNGSLYVQNRANYYDGAFLNIKDIIQANKLYVIRGFLKTQGASTYVLNAKIGSGSPVYKQLSRIAVDDQNWNRFKTYAMFTQDEIDSGINIYVNNISGSKASYYLDDIEIVQTDYNHSIDSSADILKISDDKIVDKNGSEVKIKGINIIAYNDDQSESAEDFMNYTYFNIDKHDMKNIKDMGFNAIRVSLWYKYFEDDSTPNVYKTLGDQWLDTIIGWAKEEGLYVMLDMHAPQGGGFQGPGSANDFWTDESYKTRYVNLWKYLAQRYKNESTVYAYDILNEPSPPNESDYRTLVNTTVNAIRAIDNKHIINVEVSFAANGVGAGESFKLDGVQNIIYDFHFYDPWSGFTDHNTNIYGTTINKNTLLPLFEEFSNLYTTNDLPLCVSEFGQKRDIYSDKNSTGWVNDVMDIMDSKGVNAYFYFSYKGNEFALYKSLNKYSDHLEKNEALVNLLKSRQN